MGAPTYYRARIALVLYFSETVDLFGLLAALKGDAAGSYDFNCFFVTAVLCILVGRALR